MAAVSAFALSLALLAQNPAAQPTEPAPPAAAVAPAGDPPLPPGAPADDYGFINWCWGALSGHMAVYPRVRDQLDPEGYSADEQQMAAGRAYLALYEQAIGAADQASSRVRTQEAIAGRNAGANVWAAAASVDPVQLKWAYLGWSLPGRCEVVARRLLANSELMAPALRTSSAAAAGVGVGAPATEAAATSSGGGLGVATPATTDPTEPPATQPVDPTAEPQG